MHLCILVAIQHFKYNSWNTWKYWTLVFSLFSKPSNSRSGDILLRMTTSALTSSLQGWKKSSRKFVTLLIVMLPHTTMNCLWESTWRYYISWILDNDSRCHQCLLWILANIPHSHYDLMENSLSRIIQKIISYVSCLGLYYQGLLSRSKRGIVKYK